MALLLQFYLDLNNLSLNCSCRGGNSAAGLSPVCVVCRSEMQRLYPQPWAFTQLQEAMKSVSSRT